MNKTNFNLKLKVLKQISPFKKLESTPGQAEYFRENVEKVIRMCVCVCVP